MLSDGSSRYEDIKKEILKHDSRRKTLQAEASSITTELTSPPLDNPSARPAGINDPLVDKDGYPRANIDLVKVRMLRKRLAEIRTDYASVMALLERASVAAGSARRPGSAAEEEAERLARLKPKPKPKFDVVTGKWIVRNWDGSTAGLEIGDEREFEDILVGVKSPALLPAHNEIDVSSFDGGSSVSSDLQLEVIDGYDGRLGAPPLPSPFAKVGVVTSGSPAQSAGFLEGDLILKFGAAHARDGRGLGGIAEVVALAAGNSDEIIAIVRRCGESSGRSRVERLMVRPRNWDGRGTLGCHILPI